MSFGAELFTRSQGGKGALQLDRWLLRKVSRNVLAYWTFFAQHSLIQTDSVVPPPFSLNRNFIMFLYLCQFKCGRFNFTQRGAGATVSIPLDKHWATCYLCLTLSTMSSVSMKSCQARHKSFVNERGTLFATYLFLF